MTTSVDSGLRGPSQAEAAARLARSGPNELAPKRRRSLIVEFLANLYQVFALLLWVSAALAFASGSAELGWAIIVVILVNALFAPRSLTFAPSSVFCSRCPDCHLYGRLVGLGGSCQDCEAIILLAELLGLEVAAPS